MVVKILLNNKIPSFLFFALLIYALPTKAQSRVNKKAHLLSVDVVHPSDTSICQGSSVSLTVTGAPNNSTYSWTPSAGLSSTTTADPIATPVNTTKYYVTVTDPSNAKTLDSVTITILPPIKSTVAVSNLKCNGVNTGTATVSATGTGTITYTWAPTGGSGAEATGLAAGFYTVSLNDATGCQFVDVVTITQPQVLGFLNATGLSTSCNGSCDGQAVVIPSGGTSGYTYSWSTTGSGLSVSNLCAGTYSVTIYDANNCQKDTTLNVTQPSALTSVATSFSGTCNLPNGRALVTAQGGTTGPGGYSYFWSNGERSSADTNLTATIYSVTVTDNNNCSSTASVTVMTTIGVNVLAHATPVKCFEACNGIVVTEVTSGTQPFQYTWSNSATGATADNLCPGSYTVSVTDKNSCSSTSVATITQPAVLTAPNLNSINGCADQTQSLTVTPSGGTGAYTIDWMPGGLTGATVSLQPTTTTTYTITTTDANGCTYTQQVVFNVNPTPDVNFTSDKQAGCPNPDFCVTFTDESTVAEGTIIKWMWTFGDGSTASTMNPQHCYTGIGSDTVFLQVTTTSGCSNSDTVPNIITVYPNPKAAFVTNPKASTVVDPTFNFINQSTGDSSWLWEFGYPNTVTSSTGENPTHTFPSDSGFYCTKLTVTSNKGCMDTITSCVYVGNDFDFYIPDSFTPNGDGINDIFNGKGVGITTYLMNIFDRWGNLVFSSNDPSSGWNGKANGGSDIAQQDIYVYKIVLSDIYNVSHNYTGQITLFR
jgi:gliding motility-associated-like protein